MKMVKSKVNRYKLRDGDVNDYGTVVDINRDVLIELSTKKRLVQYFTKNGKLTKIR